MPNISIADIRFLLSRVRGDFLPEEQGGLAPFGPTGIRDVQGVANNSVDVTRPGFWFGAADTLFPRVTFNRLTHPLNASDAISRPFADSLRGSTAVVTIGDTINMGGKLVDALNPRNISNLIVDSSNPIGFQSLDPNDPDYAAKLKLQLQDDPYTGRLSPVSGAVNPLPYSNWMSQFGQFFDHGLDFVNKGVDGKVLVEFMPSDGLYVANRATGITASRNNTVNITIGEGSTDALLEKMGLLASQGTANWEITATITDPTDPNTTVDGFTYKYYGTLVLNNTLIQIQANNEAALVRQINLYTPTTGVTVTMAAFPAIQGISNPGAVQLTFTPAPAESFNQTSPFIDLSQSYGSDASRTFFLREYLSEAEWRTALGPTASALEATITDLTTGRLVNAGATVNGVVDSGLANWAQIKANAAKVGIILHDADITAIPMLAIDGNGQLILGADGMPQLVALNKVTGETVYVKDSSVSADLVLMTTKHAFLNDMGVRLPALTDATAWTGRDLADVVTPASLYGPAVNYKTALEAHFIAGDGRLNENIGLTAVQEVFSNEHNRVFEILKTTYGFTGEQPQGGWTWTDPLTNVTTKVTGEELFQQAKLFNEMTYQHLVFDQFVRKISPNIGGFVADPLVDARVSSEFANAVYRFGHSMLPEAVGMRKYADATSIATTTGSDVVTVTMTNHGLKAGSTVTLSGVDSDIGGIAAANLNGTFTVTVVNNNSFTIQAKAADTATSATAGLATDKLQIEINKGLIEAFLNPQSYTPGTTAAQLTDGSTAQVGNRIDHKMTDALRDNLLGQPLDLATLNLVRGRDAGLPTLNEMRASLQAVAPALLAPTLNPYTSWTGFRDNLKGNALDQAATVKNFMMAYASDDILTKFATTKTLAQWYALRESAVVADQTEYMTGLKAATEAAYANATWMGIGGNLDFNRIDAWMGGLAEREVVGGMLGSTFDAVFAMQMVALQNGDAFYYLGRVPTTEFFIENMEGIQLADIVMRSSGATNVYADIFSVADKYFDAGDTAGLATAATLADLQAMTTTERVFDATGNLVMANIGRAGYVGNTLYGNAGDYVDARNVLNPNGTGNASEMITGRAVADTIDALGGNDNVRAAAGNDLIYGRGGVDFLYGDAGNDTIWGGTEDDFMYGGEGNDSMRGELGIDVMFGQNGNDLMYGGADADIMTGGAGNDTMYGGDNIVDINGVLDPEDPVAVALLDDNINGGSGDDFLYGGGGWDALDGASGHDVLLPGSGGAAAGGRDAMNGGQGDDIFIVESDVWFQDMNITDTGLTQLQLVNKGAGFRQGNGIGVDEVRFTQDVAGNIILGVTNALGVAQIFTGIERVVIGQGTAAAADRTGNADINLDASLANPGLNVGLEIQGNAGINTIIGTAFSDTIDGGQGADVMEGGLGNDIYVVDDAADVVNELTGSGLDTVQSSITYTLGAEIENLTLTGGGALQGTGNGAANVLIGGAGANLLSGLAGADTISGGAGADTIVGGAGADSMTGGTGNDRYVFASVAEIGNNALFRETITDFSANAVNNVDQFDFTAIDADTVTVGTQAFTYIGNAAFSAAGQIRLDAGVLYGNVDANLAADFSIALPNVASLTTANFRELPTVSITRTSNGLGVTEGNAGQSLHTFNVTLSAAATVATTVTWTITPTGTLTAGDFVGALTGTATIAVGQTTVPLSIAVAGDTAVETDETFTVALTNPVNARLGTATATSIILNDDIPTMSIARTSAANVLEGATNNAAAASSHTFTVSLSAATSVATTVTWALSMAGTVDAADFFGATGGTVTIPAGQTSAVVTVGVRGDATPEANETFTVTLSNPVGATLIGATATATIQNDDGATPPPPPPPGPTPAFTTVTGTNAVDNPLMGTDGANMVNAMGGNDMVNAMAGDDTVMGGAGNDSILGGAGNDSLVGETGNDTLVGDAGADTLTGGTGADVLTGGAGADVFRYVARADSTTGQGGRDTITDFQTGVDKIDLSTLDANESVAGVQAFTFIGAAGFTGLGQARFAGGQLQLNTTGNNNADFAVDVQGTGVLAGDLILSAAAPAPLGAAPLAVAPAAAPAPAPAPAATPGVTFRGQNNAETYTGTAGNDTIDVRGGNDVVSGLAGNDSIVGGTGNDNLNGGAGADVLTGGAGADVLTGGTEADAFVFLAIGDSTTAIGGRDTITDFESGLDKIDLSAIDANASLGGLQDFTFIGADAFTALGQVRFANGLLEANTTGDAGADFSITVQGSSVIAADVIL